MDEAILLMLSPKAKEEFMMNSTLLLSTQEKEKPKRNFSLMAIIQGFVHYNEMFNIISPFSDNNVISIL